MADEIQEKKEEKQESLGTRITDSIAKFCADHPVFMRVAGAVAGTAIGFAAGSFPGMLAGFATGYGLGAKFSNDSIKRIEAKERRAAKDIFDHDEGSHALSEGRSNEQSHEKALHELTPEEQMQKDLEEIKIFRKSFTKNAEAMGLSAEDKKEFLEEMDLIIGASDRFGDMKKDEKSNFLEEVDVFMSLIKPSESTKTSDTKATHVVSGRPAADITSGKSNNGAAHAA